MALMITNTLDGFSRHAGIGIAQGKISGVIQPAERSWSRGTYQWDEKRSDKPRYFRLTRQGAEVSAYISTDSKAWEQVITGKIAFSKQCYAGLVYRGDSWTTGVCQWLPSVAPF